MTPPFAPRPPIVGVHIKDGLVRWAELARERSGVSVRRTVAVPIPDGDLATALRTAAGRKRPRLVYVHAPASGLRLDVIEGPEAPAPPGWADGVVAGRLPAGVDPDAFVVRAALVRLVGESASPRWFVAAARTAALDALRQSFSDAEVPLTGIIPFGPDLDATSPPEGGVAYAGPQSSLVLVRDDQGTVAVEDYAGATSAADAIREAGRLGPPALVTGPEVLAPGAVDRDTLEPEHTAPTATADPAFAAPVALAVFAASGGADALNLLPSGDAVAARTAVVRESAVRRVLAVAAATLVLVAASTVVAPSPPDGALPLPAAAPAAPRVSYARMAPALDLAGRSVPPGVWLRSLRIDAADGGSVSVSGVALRPDGLSAVLNELRKSGGVADAMLVDAAAQGEPGSPFRFELEGHLSSPR